MVTSLLRCLTKATLPDTEAGLRRSANLYFVIAALVCAACTAIYGWVLPRQPAMQRYRQAALDAALHGGGSGEDGADGGEAAPAWKLLEQQEQAHGRGSLDVELTHGGGPDWQATLEQQLQQPDRLGEDGRQEAADEELLNGGQGEPPSSSDAWLHDRGRMRSGSGAGSAQPLAAGEGGGGSAGAAIAVLRCIWRLALSNVLIYT